MYVVMFVVFGKYTSLICQKYTFASTYITYPNLPISSIELPGGPCPAMAQLGTVPQLRGVPQTGHFS